MSGSQHHPEDGHPDEPIGSVAEEAAKLFEACADAVGQQRAGLFGASLPGLAALFAQAAGRVGQAEQHVAAEDCTWCPVCRTVHAVRRTSPEVRAHLTSAASSLLQAAAGLLATTVADSREGSPAPDSGPARRVQRIDLDDSVDETGAAPDPSPRPEEDS